MAFSLLGAFIYILNKATDVKEDSINTAGLPVEQKHFKVVTWAAMACLFLPILFLIQWPSLLTLYVILAAVGYLYSRPFPLIGNTRLKDIFIIKNVVSAACWAAVPAFVPTLYNENAINMMTFFIALNYFTFIFAVEVVWDIRDIEGDKEAGIKTLPNVFGVLWSKVICLIPIIILFGYRLMHVEIHPIYLTAYALTILSIITVRRASHPYFFQSLVMIWIVANTLFLTQYYL